MDTPSCLATKDSGQQLNDVTAHLRLAIQACDLQLRLLLVALVLVLDLLHPRLQLLHRHRGHHLRDFNGEERGEIDAVRRGLAEGLKRRGSASLIANDI